MQSNNSYLSDFYSSTSSASNNNNNNANFPVDNIPGPSHLLNNNNSTITHNALDELRSVNEILPRYRSVFAGYPCFNIIQSRVFDVVLYTDESVVVSAPTGSGKTVIFELAIVRFLISLENLTQQIPYKIVYVAPMKALCEERLIDWHRKFANLGLTCLSVTGDSENIDYQTLLSHNLIITTPEKWDSLTRRCRDNKTLASLVKLFMVDEVHLISEDSRGPTLEAVVCRMKTIQDLILTTDTELPFSMKMRFVAVSACIPNAEDVAEWLSTPAVPARSFKFGDEMRPVKLKKVVLGYPYVAKTSTPFKFDIMLSYKLQSIMLQYAEGKPTLIFCSTRKSVEMTSKQLIQNLTINLNPQQRQILRAATSAISDSKIKEMLVNGVCYHHAGLTLEDRRTVEELFRNATLPILVTTSTLAMGVNLPAHLVIIKSTKYYSSGEYQDYSESMLLQMIGRAGRPQFDTSATAVILTTAHDKKRYETMVGGEQSVESNLHKHLTEHLNAEVVLHTITDLGVAMQWLTSTFLHIRARKNPRYYGLPLGLSADQIDKKLLDMCQIQLNRLARAGMLTIDQDDVRISTTITGSLMAKYCIAFDTMRLFTEVTGKEILQQILALISKCHEFSEIYLRVNDKKALNLLNKCRYRETIRFPFNGKIKTVDMKINCIIQAVFGCLQIVEQSLITESHKIMRIGERISKCLAEYLETKGNCYSALLNALVLAKCFHARLWENSPFVSKQLSGIGAVFSSALVAADKTTFKALLEANPRDIERIVNRKSPMGNTIQDQVAHLPAYELTFEEVIGDERFSVNLKVCLKNAPLLRTHSSVSIHSFMILLVGDTDNNMFLYEKFTHSQLIADPQIVKKFEFPATYEYEIKGHFISEDWVGFDCNVSLLPSSAKKNKEIVSNISSSNKNKGPVEKDTKAGPSKQSSHIQTFMETYFKNSKTKNPKQKQGCSSRALVNSRKSDIGKENNINVPNISNTSQPLEKFQKFGSHMENAANNSTIKNTLLQQVEQNSPEKQNSMFPKQIEEGHLHRQNSKNLEQSTRHETNSQILPKNESLQKLIDDSIQEYKKQNETKLQKLQKSSENESSKGYYLPPSVIKHITAETDSANASLVHSRRKSEFFQERKSEESGGKFKSWLEVLHQTPFRKKKPKYRLMKNMNCTANFEDSLYEPPVEMDEDTSLRKDKSITLKFKYTPLKKYQHDSMCSQIEQEPKLNASPESQQFRSIEMINQSNNITGHEIPEYSIKEILEADVKNSAENSNIPDSTMKSNENFRKTLTWRSPLVISPAEQYSPILDINEECLKGCNEENISFLLLNSKDHTISSGNKPQLKFSISVNNDSSETSTSQSETNVSRPTLRQNKFKKGGTFPLSDQAYSQSLTQRQILNTEPSSSIFGNTEHSSYISRNNVLSEDALFSTTLLENLGLIQKPEVKQISPANKNTGVRISNIQTNFENNQVKKVAKEAKVFTESQYYSQLECISNNERAEQIKLVTPAILGKKENEKNYSELNAQLQNPQVSQSNPAHQQSPKATISNVVDISKHDIFDDVFLTDFDIDTSFTSEMFSPKMKKCVSDKNSFSSAVLSHSRFSQNPLNFRTDQNIFASQTVREPNINNSQIGAPRPASTVTSYNQNATSEFTLPLPHVPSNRFSQAISESIQRNSARKRLGRYTSKFAVLPTQQMHNEFEGSRAANCQCDDCVQYVGNPTQEQLRYHQEVQNQRAYNHHYQPFLKRETSEPQHHRSRLTKSRCSRPMPEYVEQNEYFEQPQTGTNTSHGSWDIMNSTPLSNSFGYNMHGNAKRQKLQSHYRGPSTSRSYSFHDRDGFCTMKPHCYSHHKDVSQSYMPISDYPHHCTTSFPPLVEHQPTYTPIYNHGDKQFMLQRFLNSVDQKPMKQFSKTAMNRAPHCFSHREDIPQSYTLTSMPQTPLDFTICVDEMEDEEYEDDDFSSN